MITVEESMKLDKTMETLQYTWQECREDVKKCRRRDIGMRSSQIATLVLFLIRKGVIKVDE